MSWPQYQDGVARVDGRLVRFGRTQIKALAALLVAHPERGLTKNELIEAVYEDPDREPDSAGMAMFSVMVFRLRKKGIRIATRYGWRGYRIPVEARATGVAKRGAVSFCSDEGI